MTGYQDKPGFVVSDGKGQRSDVPVFTYADVQLGDVIRGRWRVEDRWERDTAGQCSGCGKSAAGLHVFLRGKAPDGTVFAVCGPARREFTLALGRNPQLVKES